MTFNFDNINPPESNLGGDVGNFFVTGFTGFLGREVVARLLLDFPDSEFYILLRGKSAEEAESRGLSVLEETLGKDRAAQHADRVKFILGDLSLENFGWGASQLKEIAGGVDNIFHCAADTNLDLSLVDARAANVSGTERVLKFASHCQKEVGSLNQKSKPVSFFHTSTAYAAGDTQQTVGPQHVGDKFKNYYEQSKAEAEALVRHAVGQSLAGTDGSSLRAQIFRPSVIVGDSATGRASSFPVIYVPARFLMKGLLTVLPAHPNVPFDLVPVDYVADSIAKLVRLDSQNQTAGSCEAYHLTAGAGRESTPQEILEQIFKTLNEFLRQSQSLPPLISPAPILKLLTCPTAVALSASTVRTLEKVFGKRLEMVLKILPFIPYMDRNPQFDTQSTIKELQFEAPKFDEYASKVFEYCLTTNWGRKPTERTDQITSWVERESLLLAA